MYEDQTIKSLQIEFEEILTCIKPIYLSWKSQQDKSFIAGWIKKLTNLKNVTLDSMHLRNLYILALYENLRRDILCDPFTKNPPADELPPLSNHLRQLIEKFSIKHTTPDWLENDEKMLAHDSECILFRERNNLSTKKIDINCLENAVDYEEDDYVGDLKLANDMQDFKQNFLINSEKLNPSKSNESENGGLSFGDVYKYHNFSTDWVRHSLNQVHEKDSKLIEDHEGLKQNLEDTRLKYKPNEYNSFNKVQEKEMERRLAQLQNAYHEDILKLRNQNEIEIQNIINRKNAEIEVIRTNFKEKIQEQEIQMQILETKANDCVKQLQLFQETKLKEIEQIKRNHIENMENYNHENELKITNLMDDFQNEKLKLIEENRRREELFSKETKEYFEKVKFEFNEKSTNNNRQIIDLETDIAEMKNSKNKIVEQNEKLKLERDNLFSEVRKLQNELSESQKRYQFIDSQHNRLMMSHEKDINSLKETLETALHKVEVTKDEIEVKAHDKIEELENQVKDLQIKLLDAHRTYKKELENINMNYGNEKFRSKQAYEDELESVKLQLRNLKFQSEPKIQDLLKKLELKDTQLNQAIKELEMKEKMSVQLIEDIKQETSHSHDRQMRKKQFEFEQIELELKQEIQEKNKEVIDLMHQLSNHKQETELKLSEIRKWSDNQILSLTNDWKQEKLSLEKDFQLQLSKEIEEHKKTIDNLNEERNKKITELQNSFESKTQEIPLLKRELYQQAQNHKTETNDLIHLYESEKAKIIEDHKIALENLSRQANEIKTNLEEKQAENISQILSKTNIKLKEIENEYGERSMQSFKVISELKVTTEKLKEEKIELLNAQEECKIKFSKKYSNDIENLQKVIKNNLESYKKELSNEQFKSRSLEKQLERKDHEIKKQINFIKLEYETKLSKLMPVEVQNDYEETIQSLRTQISFLQQKIGILEDEVTSTNIFKTYQSNGFSKHKCDKLFE